MFAAFSAMTTVSELSGSHNSLFPVSADNNVVKRHGPEEVTRKRILAWASEDTSEVVLLSGVPYKHLLTFYLYYG